jgi:hypothetical protein
MTMRREAVQRRRPSGRDSRRTILVYCGAARTEPDYFNGLKSSLRTPEGSSDGADRRRARPEPFDERMATDRQY